MTEKIARILVPTLIALLLLAAKCTAAPVAATDTVIIRGTVSDLHGRPVRGAELHFFLDHGEAGARGPVLSSETGDYRAELMLPRGSLPGAFLEVEAQRPNYHASSRARVEIVAPPAQGAEGARSFAANADIMLARAATPALWIAAITLGLVYLVIAFELMHRTLAAFLGATIILFVTYTVGTFNSDYVILPFDDAVRAIDMNVIFLLMAMMIIVGILKKTGLFQWMAYKSYQVARGNVFALVSILLFITGFLSAFLDNVTTMLLIIPVSVEIAVALRIDPIKLLVPEAFASNVGGTATLIGDPPNIMIGSYAHLSFIDFGHHLTPICAICLAVSILYFGWRYRKDYAKAKIGNIRKMIEQLRAEYRITNMKLLTQGLMILGLTILFFLIHGYLGMPPSIAAMAGAALLMVVSKVDIVEMLEREIEWPTLIFFAMLFVVVGGALETGLIDLIADGVRNISGGSLIVAVLVIFWVSAIASAVIDNIPFTATMLPIVAQLSGTFAVAHNGVLWWALALGACLGGNGTMIGASANLVTVGIAERAGYGISFARYFKMVAIPTLLTLLLCMVWLLAVEVQ